MREAGRDSAHRLYVGSYFCGQYFLRQSDALWREAFCSAGASAFLRRSSCRCSPRAISHADAAWWTGSCTTTATWWTRSRRTTWACWRSPSGATAARSTSGGCFRRSRATPGIRTSSKSRHSVPVSALLTDSHVGDEVRGVEIDPTHAALDLAQLRGLAPQMRVGVHVPYCFMSTGSICELASLHRPVRCKFRPNDSCSLECARCAVGYALPGGARLLKWGRTVLFPNHGCTVFEGEDFRMIVTPLDLLVRRPACDRGELAPVGAGGTAR